MPLRTALIGLSSTATTSWASTAHLPTLLSPHGHSLFQISALCNSSIAAAQSAIKTYNLGPSTKAYGDPEDLANDNEIDLVICVTRVDLHLSTILPSLKKGKSVFVEWPIASTLSDIEEIVSIVKTNNASKNGKEKRKQQIVAIGLQGRFAPPVLKVKEVLHSGVIGRLLSSEVRMCGGTIDREFLPPGLKYFAQKSVGGNVVTIGFAHVIDFIQSVTGDLISGSEDVHFALQRPEIRIRDPKTRQIIETVKSDVPDLVSVHGSLPPSPHVTENATLLATFTRGQPFPGDPALVWTLTGELGSIRLVAESGIALQASAYDAPVTISLHTFDTDEVLDVPWGWSEEQMGVPVSGRSVQTCLFGIGEGDEKGYVGLEEGVKRARQVYGWLDGWRGVE
ncbi:Gfo/Idh/MocA family protein [Aspergillus stella-maris]|uniref:Gfo/Idh/MocA family protein n=1 Tax=Aspergillus stella-maris TaxID=1810926 RepID=UPI003CCD8A5A